MSHDPTTGPRNDNPYTVLADVGVTPQSSMKEVLDSSFELMQQDRWTPEARSAWHELRMVERRLLVDFLYGDVADADARICEPETNLFDVLVRDPNDLEYDR